MNEAETWLEDTLNKFKDKGPANLVSLVLDMAKNFGSSIAEKDIKEAFSSLVHNNPNYQLRLTFFKILRMWDSEKTSNWIEDSSELTQKRRLKIYEKLGIPVDLQKKIDKECPVAAKDNSPSSYLSYNKWFSPSKVWNELYYWNKLSHHLQNSESWSKEAVQILDSSTTKVLEKLSDPLSPEAKITKGLVVGYVQSGKTSHFTGLIAKASDCGYKVIIVLAGTLEILRDQTQKRLDRHIIGFPDIGHDYDLKKTIAVNHGDVSPSKQNLSFDWERLTARGDDYKSLGRLINAIHLEKQNDALPINSKENLHSTQMGARLIVIKKNESRINKIIKDFKNLQRRKGIDLSEIPVLLIDDESDQASLSFGDNGNRENAKPTNRAIRNLIECFPRCQYVGYTATPFANILVNPDNLDDIFPRDFIIPLDRPVDYMGIKDFVDLDIEDYRPDDLNFRKNAYIREIEGQETDTELKKAIDLFLLTGALKLYREQNSKYKFKDHTMLIHTDMRVNIQNAEASRVKNLLADSEYEKFPRTTLLRLKNHWVKDIEAVSRIHGNDLPLPKDFSQLTPYLEECWNRIKKNDFVYIVNDSEHAKVPDFEQSSIWGIVIGGNKLSRGYTVEGLTISYFRRRCAAADTLLQMGRWFGFRKGYHDLMRVFMGSVPRQAKVVKDKKSGKEKIVQPKIKPGSIYDDFVQACRMEEKFREVIEVYNQENRKVITPAEVPPLIYAYGLLPPVSKNKLFNAEIIYRNFSGKITETGKASDENKVILQNWDLFSKLLKKYNGWKKVNSEMIVKRPGGAKYKVPDPINYFSVSLDSFIEFLSSYKWDNGNDLVPPEISLLKHFLISKKEEHGIKNWLFISIKGKLKIRSSDICEVWTRSRNRSINRDRFLSISDPAHKVIADLLVGKNQNENVIQKNKEISKLINSQQGVTICYSFETTGDHKLKPSLIMFHVCPENSLPREVGWSVIRENLKKEKPKSKKRSISKDKTKSTSSRVKKRKK